MYINVVECALLVCVLCQPVHASIQGIPKSVGMGSRGHWPPLFKVKESHYYYYMRECRGVSMIAMWLIDYKPHVNSS